MKQGKEVFSYDEALQKTMEFFNGDDLPADVTLTKYLVRNEEDSFVESSPEDILRRIAAEIARVEKKKFKDPMSEGQIYEYLEGFNRIIPQGSPLFAIGNDYQLVSASNCFVVDSCEDSYGGILKTDQEIAQICKRRGGVGTDLSKLRPAGTRTTNAARTSTGIISFAERFSNTTREVGQNGRRGALMLTLSIHHPQVVDFAEAKLDSTKITGANVSIRLTDEFLDAVEKGVEYEQRWPVDSDTPEISQMVDAREVWQRIIHCARERAEPGLLFWDNILKGNPADCYENFKTICTNPCSELTLSAYDSCRLLLLNTFSYVINPFTKEAYFDYEAFAKDAKVAQRFMDDIVDIELEYVNNIIKKIKGDPEDKLIKSIELELWRKIRVACADGRRTGTGLTAIGDTLAALGIKYASKKGIKEVEDIYKTLKLACYRSSVEMAKELGPFPVWDHECEKNNEFLLRIKEEDPDLWEDMKKHGRRNISLLTTAPAGSVSILAQTTSGIEPLFAMKMMRRRKVNPKEEGTRVDFVDDNGDSWQHFQVVHPKIQLWIDITGETDLEKSPWFGCLAEDLNWTDRVKLQAAAQRHVDHSISSTVNLPADVSEEVVRDIYEMAWKSGCKGITVYRDGCRDGVLVKEGISKTNAPKRPEELACDIYHISVMGEKFFVIIGLYHDDPYEIFAGADENFSNRNAKSGTIKRLKRGHYQVSTEAGNIAIYDTNGLVDAEKETVTRLISTALRHGADISFIVQQLERTNGPMMSFNKSIARALKKYIGENRKVSGETCSVCNTDSLVYQEGCKTCSCCGFSACN